MNTNIIYKGIQYIVVWIVIYLTIKYTSSDELTDIDLALIATVLTLLLCILESINTYSNLLLPLNKLPQENMQPLATTTNTPVNTNLNITEPINKFLTNLTETRASNNSSNASSNASSNVSSDASSNVSSDVSSENSSNQSNIVKNKTISLNMDDLDSHMSAASSNSTNDIPNPSTSDIPSGDAKNYAIINKPDNNIADNNFLNRNYAGQQTIVSKPSNIVSKSASIINKASQEGIFVRSDKTLSDSIMGPTSDSMDSTDTKYDNPEAQKRYSATGKELQWYEQSFNPRSYAGADNLNQIAISGGKTRDNQLVNEMIYSDFNRLPPSSNDKDFEYGYSFIPPRDWYPLPVYPPVCVSNSPSQVQPVFLDTMTMDLKEWHETQKITPPDSINTSFITNEINSKV
jgi:hypothetical protein